MKITVITPTYNREKLLSKLYESIVDNSNYGGEIEWLIIDDGSKDNTKKMVDKWKEEKKIEIKYEFQENQGKMNAINHMVPYATGDLIIECDSDDFFTKDAFSIIEQTWNKNYERKYIYAFCFLKYDTKGNNMGKNFSKQETTMFDLYFKEGEDGEKALVFFGNIRKHYQYQIERNEKFSTEARMHHKMDENYKIVTVNEPIMICEYQQEGYTKNIAKQFKENPYGYYEYFKEILQREFKGIRFSKRLYVIKHYILFSYLTKQYKTINIKEVKNKVLYFMLLLPGIIKTKLKYKGK